MSNPSPDNPILIIGAGPAGLEAARGVAELGYRALVVEKASVLGGNPILASYAALTPDMEERRERDAAHGGRDRERSAGRNPHRDDGRRRRGRGAGSHRHPRDRGRRRAGAGRSGDSLHRFPALRSGPGDPDVRLLRVRRRDHPGRRRAHAQGARTSSGRRPARNRSGSASSSASAAATARSATSGARRSAAASPARRRSRFATWCPTARSSSSTSTCGCTASGKTRSTGRRRSRRRFSSSAASSPRSRSAATRWSSRARTPRWAARSRCRWTSSCCRSAWSRARARRRWRALRPAARVARFHRDDRRAAQHRVDPREGYFAAGATVGPADLEDSISSAGAAAMKAAVFLRKQEIAKTA